MTNWQIAENMVTMACSAVVILGLYALGAGLDCLWGLLFLLNLAYPVSKK